MLGILDNRNPVVRLSTTLVALAALIACATPTQPARAQAAIPGPGMHAYARSRGMDSHVYKRMGGPLTVHIEQTNGKTRFILPGTRAMDPAIFGSPEHPAGFEPAPFPMSGVDLKLRKIHNGQYSIVDHATPFSDWYETGTGSVKMTAVDVTAIDSMTTEDTIDFEANFELPDGAKYRVVCNKPLAHGGAFPFFGGVVTNHLIHGGAGIAPRLLPTTFAYVAFWGAGNVYKNGSLINEGQLVHVWIDDNIPGKDGRMRQDREAGNASTGVTLHMIVPPYKPVPGKGMVKTPLKTMFMPFPYVKPNIMKEMQTAQQAGDTDRLAVVKQIKEVMDHTKAHVVEATAAGKMFGMPFIHMKFDEVKGTASH